MKNLEFTNKLKPYLDPAFLVCVVIIGGAALAMPRILEELNVKVSKIPLPIKQSLDLLENDHLEGYIVHHKKELNDDAVESLGTEDYIEWTIEDEEAASDSNVRFCNLFITYYDSPDRVPHVPEECYTGGGNQIISTEAIALEVDNIPGAEGSSEIPARYLVFAPVSTNLWENDGKFPLLYLFRVNDVYANSREDARYILNKNIFGKHSYFSKVEWKFFNISSFGKPEYPTKEEALKASQKLLSTILPKLQEEYWPSIK